MDWEPWSTTELNAWTQAWVEGFVGFLAVALLMAMLVLLVDIALGVCSAETLVRRRFWCRETDRDVEVAFRWPATVVSCTAFGPATAIACRRGCLDPIARERCQPPLLTWRP